MNKAEMIDSLTQRLGDKKVATAAIDGVVDIVNRALAKGEKVTIAGFGTFEKVPRAARKARNPRTGETVKVKKTSVPKFRPGTGLKSVAAGETKMGREPKHQPLLPSGVVTLVQSLEVPDPAPRTTRRTPSTPRANRGDAPASAKKTTTRKTAAKKTTTAAAKKATPAKEAPAKATRATKATGAAKKTATRKNAASATPAKKTTTRKTAAKKAPAKKTVTAAATKTGTRRSPKVTATVG